MPHLQEKGDDNAASRPKLGRSFSSGSELPITEAKEGFLEATEGLLTIRSMNMAAVKTSDSFGPSRTVSDDSSCTPRSHSAKQSVVTPSPFGPGGAVHHGSRLGPVMTIYGSTKLVPSPIRGKRRLSQSDDDDDEHLHDTIHMAHPRNLRYGDAYNTPTKPSLCHTVSEGFEMDEIPKKRLLGQLEKGEESPSKKTRGWNNKEIELEAQAVNDDATNESSNIKISPRSKKPIISPASSTEKGEDVEGATMIQRSEAIPSYGHGFAHQSYPPHRHPFPPGYAHSPFGTGYPMYGAYHPPMPPPHFMGRPTGAPGAPFYHPYPPHHPAMMHHFRRPPPAHPLPGSPHQMRPAERSMPSPEVPKSSPTLRDAEIKSVEEWRHAALTTGKPPCANRCVALKEPIPSKYWGYVDNEATPAFLYCFDHCLTTFSLLNQQKCGKDDGRPPSRLSQTC